MSAIVLNDVWPAKRVEHPFPGLRPFGTDEGRIFFGREEQCDDLLDRLARHRIVAVVGASGSGKSSLVRAGLIPALHHGYLESGKRWRIAMCTPEESPLAKLAEQLAAVAADPALDAAAIREMLDRSSLGLVAAARRLAADGGNLLVVIDQFEEIFRYRRLGGPSADDNAAAFVKLLISAAASRDAPVYVVLTMRSDYLGDCAQFVGLPEALNDSQFLVPQMSREQIKAAIEGPVYVGDATIEPELVQRLLHDVERLSSRNRAPARTIEADPLPLLQHALMRIWEVSAPERAMRLPLAIRHYEHERVGTLSQSLDIHADEAYRDLADEPARLRAERIFQQLTERDPANRDIRQPRFLRDLATVALRLDRPPTDADVAAIEATLEPFARDRRSFVIIKDGKADISHESLIRQWARLSAWVDAEAASRRLYVTLANSAEGWTEGRCALYRGPQLQEARRWRREQKPTAAWAARYGGRFDVAEKYLSRSIVWRRWRWTGLGAAAILIAGSIWLAVTTRITLTNERAARAEEDAAENERFAAREVEFNRLLAQAAAESNARNRSILLEKVEEARRQGLPQEMSADERTEFELLKRAQVRWEQDRQRLEAELRRLQQRPERPAPEPSPGPVVVAPPSPAAPSPAPVPIPTPLPPVAVLPAPAPTPAPRPSSPVVQPSAPTGNYITAYRNGLTKSDLREWRAAAAFMEDAIRLQPDRERVSLVRMYGTRFEPYIPLSYKALALLNLNECEAGAAAMKSALSAEGLTRYRQLYQNVLDAQANCGP